MPQPMSVLESNSDALVMNPHLAPEQFFKMCLIRIWRGGGVPFLPGLFDFELSYKPRIRQA